MGPLLVSRNNLPLRPPTFSKTRKMRHPAHIASIPSCHPEPGAVQPDDGSAGVITNALQPGPDFLRRHPEPAAGEGPRVQRLELAGPAEDLPLRRNRGRLADDGNLARTPGAGLNRGAPFLAPFARSGTCAHSTRGQTDCPEAMSQKKRLSPVPHFSSFDCCESRCRARMVATNYAPAA